MRIGIYTACINVAKGNEHNVSGHIQVPLHAATKLIDFGHDVMLVSTAPKHEHVLPACYPQGIHTRYITDSRKRGDIVERKSGHTTAFGPLKAIRQVRELAAIASEENLDVLYFWGFLGTSLLAGATSFLMPNTPTAVSFFAAPNRRIRKWERSLLHKVQHFATATAYASSLWQRQNISIRQIKHGIVRNMESELDPSNIRSADKKRILFWRDPSYENGADIVSSTYIQLAPEFPEHEFTLAIRQHWNAIPGLDKLPTTHPNIIVHKHPYPPGVSISELLLGSICVLMPIREMSIDPQLVIAESLAAGIPTITTDQRSNPELITHNESGWLVPLDDPTCWTDCLRKVLLNPESTQRAGKRAAENFAHKWNWDTFAQETTTLLSST